VWYFDGYIFDLCATVNHNLERFSAVLLDHVLSQQDSLDDESSALPGPIKFRVAFVLN
jgi:hypothetical protein